jgi:hypothetical protein
VLPAARDALDERRLVGTAASDLNTLAGTRGAQLAPPYERENEQVKPSLISKMRLWGSGRLPQGGESPLPLPRGLGRRCGRRRCGHRRTPSRPSGARRRLRSARRLSCRLPGGRRFRTHPRRCLLHRLRGY